MATGDFSSEVLKEAREWARASRHFSDFLRSAENEELKALRKKIDTLRKEVLDTCADTEAKGRWEK